LDDPRASIVHPAVGEERAGAMKLNRLTFGLVAAAIATAVTSVLALVIAAAGGRTGPKLLLLIFGGAAGAVMWLGEASGLMRDALQKSPEPVLGLDTRRSS
jgi:hypothetical protein